MEQSCQTPSDKTSKLCVLPKCKNLDHTNCVLEFRKKESERTLKYYYKNYENNRYVCECGITTFKSNKNKHEQSNKHKKILSLKLNDKSDSSKSN